MATPNFVGIWRVAGAEVQKLEKTLETKRGEGKADDVTKLEAALAHWRKLVLRVDGAKITGDLGGGLETFTYKVKSSWIGADDHPVLDLELRGERSGSRTVSVLFLGANQVLFQGEKLRIPLQRSVG